MNNAIVAFYKKDAVGHAFDAFSRRAKMGRLLRVSPANQKILDDASLHAGNVWAALSDQRRKARATQ